MFLNPLQYCLFLEESSTQKRRWGIQENLNTLSDNFILLFFFSSLSLLNYKRSHIHNICEIIYGFIQSGMFIVTSFTMQFYFNTDCEILNKI